MAPSPARWPHHLLLQVVIVAWGFTAVLGKLMTMHPMPMVAWRTGIAALALAVMAGPAGLRRFGTRRDVWLALGTGALIGCHWICFFLAGRLGNVSVGLAGVSTAALWVALLEPLLVPERRLHRGEVVLAVAVVAGAALVAGADGVSLPSFFTGVAAALTAALFSIANGQLVRRLPALALTFWEMLAASVVTGALGLLFVRPLTMASLVPPAADWPHMLVLSLVCTVFAFSACVWLQRRISTFTVGLMGNLEPLYGMALAWLILGSSEAMGPQFYAGAAIITGCVAAHAALSARKPQAPASAAGDAAE